MFDYTNNIRSTKTTVCTPERFKTVINSTKVSLVCEEIARWYKQKQAGAITQAQFDKRKNELKQQLPVFLFHAHFADNHRSNASAVPSGLCILDIDHIASPSPSEWRECLNTPTAKLKSLGIVLIHKTPSCEGLRIVFRIPQDILNQRDNPNPQNISNTPPVREGLGVGGSELALAQKWLAAQLGIENYDTCVKDYARCSYVVPQSYIYYIDEEGLFKEPETTTQPTSTTSYPPPSPPAREGGLNTPTTETAAPTSKSNQPPLPDGRGWGWVFDSCLAAVGLSPTALSTPGIRHNSLISLLSFGICRLMPKEQLLQCLQARAPEYYEEKDCRQLVDDWYAKYNDTSAPMSHKLQKVFTESLRRNHKDATAPANAFGNGSDSDDSDDNASRFSVCPNRLPPALKATVESVPDEMRMPILCAVLPLAAAYADNVEVGYIDGMRHKLALMSMVIGPQASGKSVCSRMVNIWLQPMIADDTESRRIDEEWHQKRDSRKASERAPLDPKVTIRFLPVTVSCSTLLKRLKQSRGHCLYSFGEELDTLVKSNGAGSWSEKYDVYRLAFDLGLWGQDYNNDRAESGLTRVFYNLSLLGTYGAFKRCFRDENVENGLSSRFMVSEMPDYSFAPLPKIQEITGVQLRQIREGITDLVKVNGYVDTPKLRKAIEDWVEEKRIEALADGDTVKDTYRKRAAVIGFRCGVVFYLLSGKESKDCLDFARLMAEYVLYEQCKFFGEALLKSENAASFYKTSTANKRLLDILTDTFTFDDVRRAKGSACSYSGLRAILHRWVKSGWITKVATNQWQKQSVGSTAS